MYFHRTRSLQAFHRTANLRLPVARIFRIVGLFLLLAAIETPVSWAQDSPDHYSAMDTIKTAPRAKTMTFDPVTKRLYLSTAEAGQFEILVVGKN